jgi:hypothetical protein
VVRLCCEFGVHYIVRSVLSVSSYNIRRCVAADFSVC